MLKKQVAKSAIFFMATMGMLISSAIVSLLVSIKSFGVRPWLAGILSLGLFFFAILTFIILLILSEIPNFSEFRYLTLWISRLGGTIYGWLESGWRPPVVRLADVLIIVWIVEILFYRLESSWAEPFLNATLYKATLIEEPRTLTSILWITVNERLLGFTSIEEQAPGSNPIFWAIAGISAVIWLYWKEIIGIWFLLEVVGFAHRASHQLVIEEVVDYTTNPDSKSSDSEKSKSNPDSKSSDEEKPKSITVGLSDLLRTKLVRISELYRVVDEQRAIPSEPGAGRPIDATIKAEDIGGFLTSAVSTDSKFELGPFSIPASTVAGLIGLILRGPRIVVGLHAKEEDDTKVDDKKEGNEKKKAFFLTAHMTSDKKTHSWFVDSPEPLEDEDQSQKTRTIDDMVTELAHRIFADLSSEGSDPLPWKAAWYFNEGLRAYRDCLHTNTRRTFFLKKAEKNFIESLGEKDDSSPTYYNLGVVYTELNELDAAEAAFSKAIEEDKEDWKAYYALALNIFERYKKKEDLEESYVDSRELNKDFCKMRPIKTPEDEETIEKRYQEAVSLCRRIIRLLDGEASFLNKDYANLAKTYNLMGDIQGELSRHVDKETHLTDAIKSCGMGARHSWRAFLEAVALSNNVEIETHIASECLIDLAFFHSNKYKLDSCRKHAIKAEKLLKQAIYIDPADPNLYFELGRSYCSSKNYDDAIESYDSALQIEPENSKFRACLAAAACHLSRENAIYLFNNGVLQKTENNVEKEAKAKAKAFSTIDNIVLYGPNASSDALKKAARVCSKLGENASLEKKSLRLERASLLAELNAYPDKECRAFSSVKKKLERAEEKFGNSNPGSGKDDIDWRFSQMVLMLDHLGMKLEGEDVYEYDKLWEMEKEPEYLDKKIRKATERLKSKLGMDYDERGWMLLDILASWENDLERLQDILALWSLNFVSLMKHDNNNTNNKKYFEKFTPIVKKKFVERIEQSDSHLKKAYVQEFSHFLIEQGYLYQDYDKHEEAKSCLEAAISLLEESDPEEIKRYGLQSLLAKSLNEIKHKFKKAALKEAQKARKLDPVSYLEHETLGEIFCDLEEFDYGLEEYSHALSWKPSDPDILFEIGRTYLKRAKKCSEKARRKDELETAAKYLYEALELYDKDRIKQRARTRYWLGKVYLNSGDYYEAIPHFRILYNLKLEKDRSKNEVSGSWLIAALQLGRTYLYIKAYDECEKLFEDIIKEIINHAQDTNIEINKRIGGIWEDPMLIGEVLAWALLGKSFSYAERNPDLEKVHNGDKTEMAMDYIRRLKDEDEKIMDLDARKRRLSATCNVCKGLIHCKLCNTKYAVRLLSLAVSEMADAKAYLYLARAYERQLELLKPEVDEQKRSIIKRNVLICCERAIDLDSRGKYIKSAETLQKKIEEKEAKEPSLEEGEKATINLEGNAKGTVSWKKPPE